MRNTLAKGSGQAGQRVGHTTQTSLDQRQGTTSACWSKLWGLWHSSAYHITNELSHTAFLQQLHNLPTL